jgi:peptidoglycan-N-acetylmuramic acid deacetylase
MVEETAYLDKPDLPHPNMSCITLQSASLKELQDIWRSFYETITGQKMTKFYRPPQGKYSINNLKMAKELGYKTFFWSLAYVDWYNEKQPTREQAFRKLLGRIHPGAIVLLHSTSKTNSEIIDELLTKWEEMGYTFGTLNELVNAGQQ